MAILPSADEPRPKKLRVGEHLMDDLRELHADPDSNNIVHASDEPLASLSLVRNQRPMEES